MKTPVILTAANIRMELLTADERQRFDDFRQKEIAPFEELRKSSLDKELYHDIIQQKEQQLYREVLSVTRPRMNTVDKLGKPILSPDEYIDRRDACTTQKERDDLNQTIVSAAMVGRKPYERLLTVDASLASHIETLNDDGYMTGQSCSGILADHPNERYVQTDELGRYVEGECIMFNKQGSHAYLTFWKPEAVGVQTNTAEQIEDIRRIAYGQGWIVQDTEIFFQPSIRLTLPRTYDGSSKEDIFSETRERMDRMYPGLYERDFLDWLEKRSPVMVQVENEHGGVVLWSDDMIMARWDRLTRELGQIQTQRRQAEHISDVHVFLGGDGAYRIRCSIDGVRQLSERLADWQLKRLNQGTDAKLVAADVYSHVFDTEREQSKGLKR